MLSRADFEAFNQSPDAPLVVTFVEFLRQRGLTTEIQFGFWDFLAYDHADKPLVAVKSVKNRLTPPILARLVTDPAPLKVILMEGSYPNWSQLEAQKVFLAATGTGVYLRNVGWRSLPGAPAADVVPDLRLKLAPRWKQDPDGVWRKTCTKCGQRKGLDGFYDTNYPTGKDPKRHTCIPCYNAPRPKGA